MIKTNRTATNIKGLVESDTICTDDGLANIEGQNTQLRTLPNGSKEYYEVKDWSFYRGGIENYDR